MDERENDVIAIVAIVVIVVGAPIGVITSQRCFP
jgi:hypothetical protein